MGKNYLTVVYEMDEKTSVQGILDAHPWALSSHTHAIHELVAARMEIAKLKTQLEAVGTGKSLVEANALTASEAVVSFAAWLSCRDAVTTLSSRHDAAPARAEAPAQAAEPADTVVLTAAQESLGVEFEKVLHDNLFDLYEESPHTARLDKTTTSARKASADSYHKHSNKGRNMIDIDAAIAAQQGEKYE